MRSDSQKWWKRFSGVLEAILRRVASVLGVGYSGVDDQARTGCSDGWSVEFHTSPTTRTSSFQAHHNNHLSEHHGLSNTTTRRRTVLATCSGKTCHVVSGIAAIVQLHARFPIRHVKRIQDVTNAKNDREPNDSERPTRAIVVAAGRAWSSVSVGSSSRFSSVAGRVWSAIPRGNALRRAGLVVSPLRSTGSAESSVARPARPWVFLFVLCFLPTEAWNCPTHPIMRADHLGSRRPAGLQTCRPGARPRGMPGLCVSRDPITLRSVAFKT